MTLKYWLQNRNFKMMKQAQFRIIIFIFLSFSGVNCLAGINYLNDMKIRVSDDHTLAEFSLSGTMTPKVTHLKNPERLVIDFPGTDFGKPLEVKNPPTSIIKNIRSNKLSEKKLRFIFELKQPVQAKSHMQTIGSEGKLYFLVDLFPVSQQSKKTGPDRAGLPQIPDTPKGTEMSLQEQVKLLNQRFEYQQKKIRALEYTVQQQSIQLGMRKPRPSLPPSKQKVPVTKSTTANNTEKIKRRPPREKVIEKALHEEGHAIFDQVFTIEPGFSYTRIDRNRVALSGFLVLDAIALGTISIDSVESDVLLFDLTGRYGITDRLQFDINVPFLNRSTTYRETAETGNQGTAEQSVDLDFALSDTSFGFSYQLFAESQQWPDVVWSIRTRAPTGRHPFGIKQITLSEGQNGEGGSVQFPEKLPSGNGVWSLTSGLSFVKTLDPVVIFSSVSYSYNFEEDFDDISSDLQTSAPGTVDLGNSLQFGLGFALALNESISMSISYSHRYSEKSRTRVDGGAWTDVLGSDASSSQLNFGLVFAVTPKFSIIASAAAGLTNDAPDSQFSLKFPYSF